MKTIPAIITLLLSIFLVTATSADQGRVPHGRQHDSLQACLRAASEIKDGYYAKVEFLTMTQQGDDAYEIEIHDKNKVEWELMCNSVTGRISGVQREVDSASDPLFNRLMKVDKDTAAKTALELYPGKLVHTEYEIEADGDASYEFDIFDHPGITYKVEVNATSGKITEVAIEKWDIGREVDEE